MSLYDRPVTKFRDRFADRTQERERRGDYLGKSMFLQVELSQWMLTVIIAVQVVPHITNAIQEWIERVAKTSVDDSGEAPDVCIGKLSCKSFHYFAVC